MFSQTRVSAARIAGSSAMLRCSSRLPEASARPPTASSSASATFAVRRGSLVGRRPNACLRRLSRAVLRDVGVVFRDLVTLVEIQLVTDVPHYLARRGIDRNQRRLARSSVFPASARSSRANRPGSAARRWAEWRCMRRIPRTVRQILRSGRANGQIAFGWHGQLRSQLASQADARQRGVSRLA